jgi:hypothetical protein
MRIILDRRGGYIKEFELAEFQATFPLGLHVGDKVDAYHPCLDRKYGHDLLVEKVLHEENRTIIYLE